MSVRDVSRETLEVFECRGSKAPGVGPVSANFVGVWPEPPHYYFFFRGEASETMSRWLENETGYTLTNVYRLAYEEWQRIPAAEQRIGPFRVRMDLDGRGREAVPGEGIPIVVNPGVVFGSGLHATTGGCLLALAEAFQRSRIRSVVDLGAGTGILSIACALLGARKVYALDCNPLAARTALKNAVANGVRHIVEVLAARDPRVLRAPVDLLVANIEWPILRGILADLRWSDYREIILSGFLDSQAGELEALRPPDFEIVCNRSLDDWRTVVLKNRQDLKNGAHDKTPCSPYGTIRH